MIKSHENACWSFSPFGKPVSVGTRQWQYFPSADYFDGRSGGYSMKQQTTNQRWVGHREMTSWWFFSFFGISRWTASDDVAKCSTSVRCEVNNWPHGGRAQWQWRNNDESNREFAFAPNALAIILHSSLDFYDDFSLSFFLFLSSFFAFWKANETKQQSRR